MAAMSSTTSFSVTHVAADSETVDDLVAIEEPLEIRLEAKPVTVTMRTPGDDNDLAAGFLFTEGVIRTYSDVESVQHWGSPNQVRVVATNVDTSRIARNFYATSSCGVCGKTSIDAVRVTAPPLPEAAPITREFVLRLPSLLQGAQQSFQQTGGVHGAALVDRAGRLLYIREDVGRHNAVDKVIGAALRNNVAFEDTVLILSSRAGFEIAQKAIVARIPILAALGAPSSLAIDLAREMNLTLLAFVREGRFNVYSGRVA